MGVLGRLVVPVVLALLIGFGYYSFVVNPSKNAYNSVLSQSLHYFSRPHEGTPAQLQPIISNAAWNGSELRIHPELWCYIFTEAERSELIEAMNHLMARYNSSAQFDISKMTVEDFPLPTLRTKIPSWRKELSEQGRGFQVLRGVPIDVWNEKQVEAFFWLLGRYLGIPGAQDNDGELLTHVRDTGANPRVERQYKTNSFIDFHCDAADVVGLLCVHGAKKGGTSRLISSVTIYNELLKTPQGEQHLRRLFSPVLMDSRGTGGVNFFPLPPLRIAEGVLRTFYHSEYFRSAHRHPKAGQMPLKTREALDAYEAIASRPDLWLDMEFLAGDVQLISNHFLLHSRTAYEDHEDIHRRRHLLRLWLSLDPPQGWWLRMLKEWDRTHMIASLLWARLLS